MMNWFCKLIALLAGDQTRILQHTDWRGRPLREAAAGTIPPDKLAEEDLFSTLRLPLFPEGGSAGLRTEKPIDLH
jgi:hypothetical protein